MAKGIREKIKLVSSAGTGHFYTTTKNKRTKPEKLELVDYKDSRNRFFVRTVSDKESIAGAFGTVSYVDAGIAGEIGFTTEEMTEAEFEKAAAQIEVRNRIRLG